MESIHKTVLLNEAIEGLHLSAKSLVVDCTFGGGGHSAEICKRFPSIKIIALDQDKNVFTRTEDKLKGCNISFINENFRNIDRVLEKENAKGVDGILFDLGLSSDQLEASGRGFSFLKDEPLMMTMKDSGDHLPSPEDVTASDAVNTWSEKNLADIIYGYGEEKYAKRIARGIVEAREGGRIETTFDLVKIIGRAVPAVYKRGRIHCATRTFQAIRIAVNDELGALSEGLEKGFKFLKNGGRISVISFHSLEDRIVKRFFKEKAEKGEANLVNKKIITAGEEEIKNNPRARSAKLRILQKVIATAG